jgi:hypothetical protein
MNILTAVGDVLEDAGVGVLATDLFLSIMPTIPDVCTAVMEYQGLTADEHFGPYEGIERPRLMVVCRAGRDDYETARENAVAARAALAAIRELDVDGDTLHRCQPLMSVYGIGDDDDGRPRVVVTFQVWWS